MSDTLSTGTSVLRIEAVDDPALFDAIWPFFQAIVKDGRTYALDPALSKAEGQAMWFAPHCQTYVARFDGRVVGSFIIKPNQAGPGSHVCNAAFMVDASSRGLGVGRQMGQFALAEARRLGYRAMQFNMVVSTNTAAVRLWKSLGFEVIGTIPGGFAHPDFGDVDGLIMYQCL